MFWNGDIVADRADAREPADAAPRPQPVQPEVHLRPNKLVTYKRRRRGDGHRRSGSGVTKIGLVGNEQFVR